MAFDLNLIGSLLSALFVMFILSLTIKDNFLFHMAEHIFIGVAAGYGIVIAADSILATAVYPLTTNGEILWIVPIILGFLLFTQMNKGYSWLSRYSIAVLIAIGTAVTLRSAVEANFLAQIKATIVPLMTTDPMSSFNNILIAIMTATTLYYFTFSVVIKQKNIESISSRLRTIGLYSLMVMFGSTFGGAIMERTSLVIGIVNDLVKPPGYYVVIPGLILIALAVIPLEKLKSILGLK